MDHSLLEVCIDSLRPYIKQFSQQITEESQQRANDSNLPSDIQNSFKEIANMYSAVTESMQSSKCIHNNSPYCTSQNLIRFIVRCLSDTAFRGKQMFQFQAIMNQQVDGSYILCIQCIMEFVIQTNKFKIVIKMNILQHMCSSICSDLFCNRTLKVCNKYELMNVFFVQEFRILYQILTYKYKHLVEESILNNVIHTLESWSEQTKCFAEFLQDVERTSANVLIEPKMMKILNDTLKCARISTTMCFNSKCVKHVKINLSKKKWKFKLCSGCMIALYCNKKCQKYHWKFGHKTQCYWFQEHDD